MIWFIYSKEMTYRYEYNAIKDFLQNNYDEGIDYLLIPIEDIYVRLNNKEIVFFNGKNKLNLDSVKKIYLIDLGKITLTTLQYRISLLKYFDELNIRIINSPKTILLCRNKIATYFALRRHKLPIIPTIISLSSHTGYQVGYYYVRKLGDIIVKPLLGSRGIGVEYLNVNQAKSRLKDKLNEEEILLIQKFVRAKNMCDMRALVIDSKVLSGMKRCAQKGQLLTNIFQGARPYPIKLPENVKSMAIEATKAVKGEIVTVDFIEDEKTNKIFIVEINGFARWEGMQKVVDFNITEEVVKYIMDVAS